MDAARSKYDMALNGARPQERQAVQDQYLQAKHQYELAEKTWNRISSLYKDSVVSLQEKDQVEFQYKAAKEQMSAAAAKYDMVVKGTRSEEIRGAQSLFHQAENGYKEALAYYQELRITSPIDGEVSKKVSEAGEVVASGYPIFTVLDPNDAYVVVQIREDLMPMIKMGATFSGVVPAMGKGEHQFAVDYIAPMGDYATWKPTNQKSDFDLKTFEVHLRCKEHIDGFRPGMTIDLYY
jgi:HlyD family secretion protein